MTHYTTTNANINSAAYRADQPKKIIYRCDLCNERPVAYHVGRCEGARVITASVCRECVAKWDEEGAEVTRREMREAA